MIGKNTSELPPGFRFHPTDEELIMFYLRNQATSRPCPVSIIPEVDIYKFDPWQLPDKAEFGENEWYFFSPRDRKYPNGVRPNRAAVSGYWKATGTDKAIYSGSKYVGVKKALVFYKGRPPKGAKTDWIMHEYRLCDSRNQPTKPNGSMKLDDWVLCRIYKKKSMGRVEPKVEDLHPQMDIQIGDVPTNNEQRLNIARTFSISHLLDFEQLGSISQLLGDNNYAYTNSTFDYQNALGYAGNGNRPTEKIQPGEGAFQYMDSTRFQGNQSSSIVNSQQPFFVNSVFEFQ